MFKAKILNNSMRAIDAALQKFISVSKLRICTAMATWGAARWAPRWWPSRRGTPRAPSRTSPRPRQRSAAPSAGWPVSLKGQGHCLCWHCQCCPPCEVLWHTDPAPPPPRPPALLRTPGMYYLVIRFAEGKQSNCQYSFNFEKHTCLRTWEVEDLPRPFPLVADGDAPVAYEAVPLQ